MFTEGLDKSALRWVKEGSVNNKKEVPMSMSSQRPRIDPVSSARTGGRGFGMPPTSKFRSGHLPDMIPVSRTIPRQYDYSRSESENDMSTDSEEEVYGGRYSLDSSPQDDRVPSNAAGRRYSNPVERKVQYGSDSMYSEDVSSSRETVGRGRGAVVDRLMKGANRYPVGSNGYTEEESSDSAASSEFSSTVRRSDIGLPGSKASLSEGYASSVPSWINKQSTSNKNQKLSEDDNPSAPPVSIAGGEIKQEQSPVSTRPNGMPSAAAATDGFERKTTTASLQNNIRQETPKTSVRLSASAENGVPSSSFPARLPTFHASALGPWHAVIAYDACVRLCLHAWAKGCMEAPMFLENECALLRNTFGLQQVLLQSEEELLLSKRSSELAGEGAIPKPKKMVGKMKVQVRKVKMSLDAPTGCSFSNVKAPKIKLEVIKDRFSNFQSTVSSGWQAVRGIHFAPRVSENGSFSRQSLAYVQASTQYLKQVSGLLKTGVATLRSSPSSYDVQETYSSLLRLKSSAEEDAIRMQPGSGETHVFFPDSLGDDLIVEVQDSKGKYYGRVVSQVAAISEDPGDKLRWWSIYREPEHELVGKLQLFINYSTTLDENSHLKCGSVAETVAYDLVLEVAMKDQHFQQRNLLIQGPWKWLLTEFASYFGVSDAYTKLRYLSYVMDVATPTADCLTLVCDLLMPVVLKGNCKSTLSHQENRILGEIEDQLEQVFALAFENYKSLDESTPSGMMDVFRPATGRAAPALEPAVKLYKLLHDILSPEAQNKLYSYFQAAAKKRSRRHLTDTDEYVSGNNEGMLVDVVTMTTAYQKMKSLCVNIRNEIFTDIDIHNQHILPSFIDLPNLSTAIYSAELCNRIRSFLIACPPSGPSPYVTELVIAAADFQRDLSSWSINPVKGGVDAKELFHLYIMLWIQDKRLALLEACKLDKVKWSGVRTQYSTTPFVDEMYDRLQEILNDYGIIISRWPEYTFALENAIADIEKAVVEALDKQYADVVSPLKENMAPKKFGLKYVQKLAKRSVGPYVVPEEKDGRFQTGRRMLPSTFQDKMKEQDTVKEMAKEIQNSQSGEAKKTTEDLDEFMNNTEDKCCVPISIDEKDFCNGRIRRHRIAQSSITSNW